MTPKVFTVMSRKGGVGKSTTALHLAAVLHCVGRTLLLDGDDTLNCSTWYERAQARADFDPESFRVEPPEAGVVMGHEFVHVVVDTAQGPTEKQLRAAAKNSLLLVIPVVPAQFDEEGLVLTLQMLREAGHANYRVLLTRVAPDESREAAKLRGLLASIEAPVFMTSIPRLKAFGKAAAAGCVVRDVDDRKAARAWQAYVAVGQELLSDQGPGVRAQGLGRRA